LQQSDEEFVLNVDLNKEICIQSDTGDLVFKLQDVKEITVTPKLTFLLTEGLEAKVKILFKDEKLVELDMEKDQADILELMVKRVQQL
jgi:hypothetical protein